VVDLGYEVVGRPVAVDLERLVVESQRHVEVRQREPLLAQPVREALLAFASEAAWGVGGLVERLCQGSGASVSAVV
jgi:hypothetical protein